MASHSCLSAVSRCLHLTVWLVTVFISRSRPAQLTAARATGISARWLMWCSGFLPWNQRLSSKRVPISVLACCPDIRRGGITAGVSRCRIFSCMCFGRVALALCCGAPVSLSRPCSIHMLVRCTLTLVPSSHPAGTTVPLSSIFASGAHGRRWRIGSFVAVVFCAGLGAAGFPMNVAT